MRLRARGIILGLLLWVGAVHAEEIKGQVVAVSDGDTVTVLDANRTQHKIRLQGIDAPERTQAYGGKATEALKSVLGEGRVVVEISDHDRYGRAIGRIFVDGIDVNRWMVQHGWAWHYKAYSKERQLADLETKARAAHIGLWADSSAPVPPWEYRAIKRDKQATPSPAPKVDAPAPYWLNTSSNIRHNASCRYFRQTTHGRSCTSSEGTPCSTCGG